MENCRFHDKDDEIVATLTIPTASGMCTDCYMHRNFDESITPPPSFLENSVNSENSSTEAEQSPEISTTSFAVLEAQTSSPHNNTDERIICPSHSRNSQDMTFMNTAENLIKISACVSETLNVLIETQNLHSPTTTPPSTNIFSNVHSSIQASKQISSVECYPETAKADEIALPLPMVPNNKPSNTCAYKVVAHSIHSIRNAQSDPDSRELVVDDEQTNSQQSNQAELHSTHIMDHHYHKGNMILPFIRHPEKIEQVPIDDIFNNTNGNDESPPPYSCFPGGTNLSPSTSTSSSPLSSTSSSSPSYFCFPRDPDVVILSNSPSSSSPLSVYGDSITNIYPFTDEDPFIQASYIRRFGRLSLRPQPEVNINVPHCTDSSWSLPSPEQRSPTLEEYFSRFSQTIPAPKEFMEQEQNQAFSNPNPESLQQAFPSRDDKIISLPDEFNTNLSSPEINQASTSKLRSEITPRMGKFSELDGSYPRAYVVDEYMNILPDRTKLIDFEERNQQDIPGTSRTTKSKSNNDNKNNLKKPPYLRWVPDIIYKYLQNKRKK